MNPYKITALFQKWILHSRNRPVCLYHHYGQEGNYYYSDNSQNPPYSPLPKGEIVIPLFGKWFGEIHHPEHVEGEGLAPWSGESYSTGRGEIF